MRAIALPVKSLAETKTRLEPFLDPLERAALTLAMLEDVLDATLSIQGWETWVVSPDETVLEVVMRRGGYAIVEERPPLSNAVRQVEDEATAKRAESLAVLLADTPLVTTRTLTVALHTIGPVVLAPSSDEGGTNLLVRRPVDVMAAHFGVDSYRRHLEVAAEADIPTSIVQIPEIAFDLDLPGDILTVLRSRKPGRTLEVCLDLDLASRIPTRT